MGVFMISDNEIWNFHFISVEPVINMKYNLILEIQKNFIMKFIDKFIL